MYSTVLKITVADVIIPYVEKKTKRKTLIFKNVYCTQLIESFQLMAVCPLSNHFHVTLYSCYVVVAISYFATSCCGCLKELSSDRFPGCCMNSMNCIAYYIQYCNVDGNLKKSIITKKGQCCDLKRSPPPCLFFCHGNQNYIATINENPNMSCRFFCRSLTAFQASSGIRGFT